MRRDVGQGHQRLEVVRRGGPGLPDEPHRAQVVVAAGVVEAQLLGLDRRVHHLRGGRERHRMHHPRRAGGDLHAEPHRALLGLSATDVGGATPSARFPRRSSGTTAASPVRPWPWRWTPARRVRDDGGDVRRGHRGEHRSPGGGPVVDDVVGLAGPAVLQPGHRVLQRRQPVDDGVRGQPVHRAQQAVAVQRVGHHRLRAERAQPGGTRRAAGQPDHPVAVAEEPAGERDAERAAGAGQQNLHGVLRYWWGGVRDARYRRRLAVLSAGGKARSGAPVGHHPKVGAGVHSRCLRGRRRWTVVVASGRPLRAEPVLGWDGLLATKLHRPRRPVGFVARDASHRSARGVVGRAAGARLRTGRIRQDLAAGRLGRPESIAGRLAVPGPGRQRPDPVLAACGRRAGPGSVGDRRAAGADARARAVVRRWASEGLATTLINRVGRPAGPGADGPGRLPPHRLPAGARLAGVPARAPAARAAPRAGQPHRPAAAAGPVARARPAGRAARSRPVLHRGGGRRAAARRGRAATCRTTRWPR